MNQSKNISILLCIFQAFGFILLILLCFSSYFWNDDFYFYSEMESVGNWNTSINMYKNWDGRGLSLNGFIRNQLIYWFSAYTNSLISTGYLILQAYLIWKIISKTLELKFEDTLTQAQSIFTFTFLLWLIYRPHIAYSHYWSTGTIYAIQSVFFLLWIYLYFFKLPSKIWLFTITTFLLVLGGVFSATAILALVIADYAFYKKKWDQNLSYFLLAFIPSSLINILAPGNYIRLESVQGEIPSDILEIIFNYLKIVYRFYNSSFIAIIAGILVSISFPIHRIKLNSLKHHRFWVLSLIAGLASLIPFSIMPNTVLNYLGIHFQVILFWVVLSFGTITRIKLDIISIPWNWGQFIVIFIFTIIAYNQWEMSRNVFSQVKHRHMTLAAHRGIGDTVYLPPIQYPNHFFTHISYEILEEPNEAHNKRLQFIYQTGPIILKTEGATSLDSVQYQLDFKFGNYIDSKLWND